jgi:hypothetical protein
LPLTCSKQLIPHPNTKKKKEKETPLKMCINYLLSCCFLLSTVAFHLLNIRTCKNLIWLHFIIQHETYYEKYQKHVWQMLMVQNSARNMPMAETWHGLSVMFHKLKQTYYTSLLANAWTVVQHLLGNNLGVRASPVALSIWAWQDISHIQVSVPYFFPTPPIKLKLGLQIGGRLLVVTHWINQKQGEINKYDLTVIFIKLKLGLQIGGRPLVVTNWSIRNKEKINKYDLIVVFIKLKLGLQIGGGDY